MAIKTEFYKGRRKRKSYIIVPVSIAVIVIAAIVVLFYSMQKYAVITKDDVAIELPILAKSGESAAEQSEEAMVLESVNAKIVFDQPDYSDLPTLAHTDCKPVRAIFVPYENITREKLAEYADRLNAGNALVLEMKPRNGSLMWYSTSWACRNYGLSVESETTLNIQSYIDMLKERDVYLVAQISCCVDGRYSTFSTSVALRNSIGINYANDTGYWLDPYNQRVRDYVVEMCQELYAMGFDEVVLADLLHPSEPDIEEDKRTQFVYSTPMSTTPTPHGGVMGFALSVAQRLDDREGALSVYTYSATSLVKTDTLTGQNAVMFWKLFDRVYYPTDKYAYTFNMEDVGHTLTPAVAASRFVPVVQNYLPADSERISWVLIDVEED